MMLNDIVKNLLKEVSGIAEIPANKLGIQSKSSTCESI